jgi:hypothetical protein
MNTMTHDDAQAAFEIANENALNYFRSLTAVLVAGIDGRQMTRETAIAVCAAVGSTIAQELPNGADVFAQKFSERLAEMRGRRIPACD